MSPMAKRLRGLFFFTVYSRHSPSRFHLKSHLLLYLPNSRDRARFNSDGIFYFVITIQRKFDAVISALFTLITLQELQLRATFCFVFFLFLSFSLYLSYDFNIDYKNNTLFFFQVFLIP